MSKVHILFAILVTVIWGSNFVFLKYGLEELPPLLFATLRFTFVVFPLIFFLSKPKTSWFNIIGYGLLIGVGQFGVLFIAMQNDISAGLASLVIQLQVIFSILLALVWFKEPASKIQWLALLISFSGIAIIASNVDAQTTIKGLLLVLFAAFSWALANMLVKRSGQVNILSFLAYSSLFAIPVLAVLSLYFEGWDLISSSIQSATLTSFYVVVWQSLGNTIFGYGLWNFLLNRYSAAEITPWALLVPVSGMLASSLLINEPMPFWKLSAASLVMMGLAMNVFSLKKQN